MILHEIMWRTSGRANAGTVAQLKLELEIEMEMKLELEL